MNNIIEILQSLIFENIYFAPFASVFAGIAASLTPCSLYILPLLLSLKPDLTRRKRFLITGSFALGTIITFLLLGTVFSFFGTFINFNNQWFYILVSILLILSALQWLDIIHFIPNLNPTFKNTSGNYLTYIVVGMGFALFSSPCSTPIIASILTYSLTIKNIPYGILLLIMFATGHSIIILIAGTSLSFITEAKQSTKFSNFNKFIKYLLASIMLLFGYYMFYLGI